MQKRQRIISPVQYVPYDLPIDFPVGGLIDNAPTTGAITFLHFHDCMEIGFCLEGAGMFFVDNKILPYRQGDVSIIFRNQIHIAQSEKSNPSVWKFIFLNPDKLLASIRIQELSETVKYSKGDQSFNNILSSQQHPEIAKLIYMIISELEKKRHSFQSAIRGLVWALMVETGRMMQTSGSQEKLPEKNNIVKVAPALEHIMKNYMNEIRIKTLASLCNMSISNFRRIFNSCMGASPKDYIVKVRIQMASILLNSTDNLILDIALKTGYTSLSSFNRHFKTITGICPREWKRATIIEAEN